MNDKAKTMSAVGLLAAMRDDLITQAKAMMDQAEAEMSAAKERYHTAKIERNRLLRKASQLQAAIGEEMQLALTEQQLSDAAYHIRSEEELAEELGLKTKA